MCKRGLYREVEAFNRSKFSKGNVSFEKYTKFILAHYFRKDISKNKVILGESSFYNTDTIEAGKYLTVNEKSWTLWKQMPVLEDLESNIYFKTKNVDILSITRNLVGSFLKQVEEYKSAGYFQDTKLRLFMQEYNRYINYISKD